MFNKLKFIPVLMTLFSILLFAGETGKIAGRVVDINTGEPIFGVNVVVVSKWTQGTEEKLRVLQGGTTDVQGDFFILNLAPGKYNVRFSYIGYQEEIISQVEVFVDKTTRLNFKMTQKAVQQKEVVVSAYKANKVEVDLTATKQVYNVEEITNMAGVSNVSDILDLQPDVIDDHFRGGRLGESAYLISGAAINNPLSNRKSFNPIVTGLQQVEVFTSGFSAEYGNAQSGVVNMVTKEGGEKWKTSFEFSATAPYYKTWEGNLYNTNNLYFYDYLSNLSEWMKENPVKAGSPLYDIGYSFISGYRPTTTADSLKLAGFVQKLWYQAMRDIGLDYKNTWDNRFDFTVGGPLYDNVKLFVAGRQETIYPLVPTVNPDVERQFMGNISYQLDNKTKLGIRFIHDLQKTNDVSISDWKRWLFDRTLSISQINQQSNQVGLDLKYVFSQATIMDLSVNIMNVLNEMRIDLLNKNEFIADYASTSNYVNYQSPAFLQVGSPNGDRGDERITTYDIKGSYLSQFNKFNLIKAGFQFTYYDVDVDRDMNVYNKANFRTLKFNVFPYEGAFYVQNKMEFEGLIANVGLRLDYYDMNVNYYADEFSPLRNPYYDPQKPYLERGNYYDRNLANKDKTKLYIHLQPRIGISFPVTENSVFHLNYGTFTQRPTFYQIFYNQVTYFNEIEILGNPRLKPENTKTYDIGLVNALPYGFRLDISAYYKDVTDLVEAAFFFDEQNNVYQTYTNRDYADIKGFNVSFDRVEGGLRGSVKYNYEVATGKSSNAVNAPVTYYEKPAEGQSAIKISDPEDIYMDYDRTHKAVFNLSYRFENDEGPEIFSIYPFENLNISTTFRFMTGRPYTWDMNGEGLKYNKRTPDEYDLRLRIEKKLKIGKGNLSIYAEGFNLLNERVYSYSGVFGSNKNKTTWELDRSNILIYNEYADRRSNPYETSQAVYVLSNQPMRFRFGLIYRF